MHLFVDATELGSVVRELYDLRNCVFFCLCIFLFVYFSVCIFVFVCEMCNDAAAVTCCERGPEPREMGSGIKGPYQTAPVQTWGKKKQQ